MKYQWKKSVPSEEGPKIQLSKLFSTRGEVVDDVMMRFELSSQSLSRFERNGRLSIPAMELELVVVRDKK